MRPAESTLRLCIASPSFPPAYGGAELRFRRYLPGLRARGVAASVVTGTPKAKKLARADREAEWYARPPGWPVPSQPLDGAPVHRIRLPDAGAERWQMLLGALLRRCEAEATRPDVVQLLGNVPARGLPVIRRIRGLGIPLVHAASIAAKPARHRAAGWLRGQRRRRVWNRFDAIVAPNAPLRDELRALGVRTRIELIPHGVDLRRFRPARDDEERLAPRRALGIDAADTLLLCVGSVSPRKGTDLLLRAFSALAPTRPDLHLVVAGPRRDRESPALAPFAERLAGLVAGCAARERLHFLGEVADVERWFRAADVFVLPSEREGMPNAMLEAMATGLPAVVTDFAGRSRELGAPGEHYALAPREAETLALTLGALVDDPCRRRRLGGAARAWLERTMDLDPTLDAYVSLYRELTP